MKKLIEALKEKLGDDIFTEEVQSDIETAIDVAIQEAVNVKVKEKEIEIEEKAKLEASGRKKLSRQEKIEIRESVKKFLLGKITPKINLYRALWNFSTSFCFIFSNSNAVHKHFCALFTKTFSMELEPLNPWSIASEWAKDNNLSKMLESLEPATWKKEI